MQTSCMHRYGQLYDPPLIPEKNDDDYVMGTHKVVLVLNKQIHCQQLTNVELLTPVARNLQKDYF